MSSWAESFVHWYFPHTWNKQYLTHRYSSLKICWVNGWINELIVYSKKDQNSEFGEIVKVEKLWVVTKPKVWSPERAEEVMRKVSGTKAVKVTVLPGVYRGIRETVLALLEKSRILKLLDSPKRLLSSLLSLLQDFFLHVSPTRSPSAPSR